MLDQCRVLQGILEQSPGLAAEKVYEDARHSLPLGSKERYLEGIQWTLVGTWHRLQCQRPAGSAQTFFDLCVDAAESDGRFSKEAAAIIADSVQRRLFA